jgi:hypothetical protein
MQQMVSAAQLCRREPPTGSPVIPTTTTALALKQQQQLQPAVPYQIKGRGIGSLARQPDACHVLAGGWANVKQANQPDQRRAMLW